jgi:hypothetical protein
MCNRYVPLRTVLATVLVLAGCGGAQKSGEGAISLSPTRSGNAYVLAGEQLWQRSSDLLSLIANRITVVQVRRTAGCPNIVMRGQKSYIGSSDADVYVNGTRAGNTCLLELMRSEDVERVEVYPMGVTGQAGVSANPNGVILIYLRKAGSPEADLHRRALRQAATVLAAAPAPR